MRILALMLCAGLAAPAAAETAAPAASAPPAASKPIVVTGKHKQVCVVETPIGSIIPKRHCVSRSERQAADAMTQRRLDAITDYKQGARSICLNKQGAGGACSMM